MKNFRKKIKNQEKTIKWRKISRKISENCKTIVKKPEKNWNDVKQKNKNNPIRLKMVVWVELNEIISEK